MSVTIPLAFGTEPQRLICPYCHADITTRIETEANTKTHLIALLFCMLALCPCAACVYCTDSCKSSKHYCPSCNAYLGQHSD